MPLLSKLRPFVWMSVKLYSSKNLLYIKCYFGVYNVEHINWNKNLYFNARVRADLDQLIKFLFEERCFTEQRCFTAQYSDKVMKLLVTFLEPMFGILKTIFTGINRLHVFLRWVLIFNSIYTCHESIYIENFENQYYCDIQHLITRRKRGDNEPSEI